jgi:hypothetical protein
MSVITDYASLKASVAARLDQDEANIDADNAIDLCEAKINRVLRIRAMETAFSDTIASGVVAVPTGFRQWKSVYLNTSPIQPLEPCSHDWMLDTYPLRSSDSKPLYVAENAGNFEFGPYPDSGYTVAGTYYATLTALSASNTTNWLTTNAPDLLFYGALSEAWDHLGDPERREFFEGKFVSALSQVEQEEEEARYPWGIAIRQQVERTARHSRPA